MQACNKHDAVIWDGPVPVLALGYLSVALHQPGLHPLDGIIQLLPDLPCVHCSDHRTLALGSVPGLLLCREYGLLCCSLYVFNLGVWFAGGKFSTF